MEDQELEEQERRDETDVVSDPALLSPPGSPPDGAVPGDVPRDVPPVLEQARAVVESVGLTDCAFVGEVTITAAATVDHAVDATVTTRATITAAVPAPVPDWVADLEPPNYRQWAIDSIRSSADPELFRPEEVPEDGPRWEQYTPGSWGAM